MDFDTNRSLIAGALARIPGGDRAALQTVYRLTSAKLFGVCLRILGERANAEDVLQEVFVTVWRKAGDFDATRASPMTWLIAIARNRAIDRLRASKNSRRTRSMWPLDAREIWSQPSWVSVISVARRSLGAGRHSTSARFCKRRTWWESLLRSQPIRAAKAVIRIRPPGA